MSEHYLHIVSWCGDPACHPDWWVEHTDECLIVQYADDVDDYGCDVGHLVAVRGMGAFGSGWWPESLPLVPGRYPIEVYEEQQYSDIVGCVTLRGALRIKENTDHSS